jgi:hypothetical protein
LGKGIVDFVEVVKHSEIITATTGGHDAVLPGQLLILLVPVVLEFLAVWLP